MRRYKFGDPAAWTAAVPKRFLDRDEALRFVRDQACDFDTLNDLRIWAHERGYRPRRDRDLFELVATCLDSGHLRVWPLAEVVSIGPVSRVAGGGEAQYTPPRAVPERPQATLNERMAVPELRIRPRDLQLPQAPPEFVIDLQRQIETLLTAAKSGMPFCEQCELAKQEAAK